MLILSLLDLLRTGMAATGSMKARRSGSDGRERGDTGVRRRPIQRCRAAGGQRSAVAGHRRSAPWWVELDDEALLDLRFCDLGLRIAESPLTPALERLHHELARRGFAFRPHYWFAEEWFSPDGIPGVAIPFYLGHPRLTRLERRLMHEVEGGNARSLIRILRHEAGHALDTAYRLRRRRRWREAFGPASLPYPQSYAPRVTSRRYVMHLGYWYAQSHPTEDFAETFAVWLAPNSTWRRDYDGWPALHKLEYVDELMAEIAAEAPPVRSRRMLETLAGNRRTLREHYEEKLAGSGRSDAERYDGKLLAIFALREEHSGRLPAASLIRQMRPQLQRLLERRSKLHPYLVDHVLLMIVHRADELDLVVRGPQRGAQRELFGLLERILFDFVRRGRERYAL